MTRIGIDVGGSGMRAARFDEDGRGEIRSVQLESRGVEAVLDLAIALINQCGTADAIGIAVPGFADGSVIQRSPNFPDWRDVPFAELLAKRTGCVVHVENDATAAAWGAYVDRGAHEDLVLLTLGTGVGGGIVSNGQLVRGSCGSAAEIGHMYVGGERLCGCGAIGCLETWISNGGLIMGSKEHGRDIPNGGAVLEAALVGDEWARAVCTEAGEALGYGLRNVVNLLNPDTVVIAGGLACGREFYEEAMWEVLRAGVVGPALSRLEIAWEGRAESLAILGVADLAARAAD